MPIGSVSLTKFDMPFSLFALEESKDSLHPKRPLTTRLVPTMHVLNATENISVKCRESPSSSKAVVASLLDLAFGCLLIDMFFLFARELTREKERKKKKRGLRSLPFEVVNK